MVRISRPLVRSAATRLDAPAFDRSLRAFMLPLDWAADTIERMAASGQPRIDRRRTPRQSHRMRALLDPVDRLGAVRSPLIYTRDADPHGLGFICRHDVSVMCVAEVSLPMTTGRPLQAPCVVRRCREIAPRWFEGMVEFTTPQPRLAAR